MATSGQDKFIKYFKDKEINTVTKSKTSTSGETAINVLNIDKKVIDTLPIGYPINVPATSDYTANFLVKYEKNSKTHVGYINNEFIAKPFGKDIKGATERLGIKAVTLAKDGTETQIQYMGKMVKGLSFTTPKALSDSILNNLRSNPAVNRDNSQIIESLENYFKDSNGSITQVQWGQEIAEYELNELGKYLGELLIGYMALKSQSAFAFGEKIVEFFVPSDPQFSGVDSFLIGNSGARYLISSKFGKGAEASFFANLLSHAMDMRSSLATNSILADLCDTATGLGMTSENLTSRKPKGPKDIVYQYGVREILKLSASEVPDPMEVFRDIKQNKKIENIKNNSTLVVIDAISAYIKKNAAGLDRIESNLPLSTTAFFNRVIAKRLNEDSKSMKDMLQILTGKNFYQANLNINKWKTGVIEYKLTATSTTSFTLKINGNKAGMADINADQGLINYLLS